VIDLTLNAGEQGMLERCEATIARGLDTFVEVGEALMEIRERRLYKAYGTFEHYCRERWRMTRQHANRTIAAAEVARALEPIGSIPTEAAARELRPVMSSASAEQVEAVWTEVVEEHGPKPTAAQVREVVKAHVAPAAAGAQPEPLAPVSPLAVHFSSKTDEWATPQAFFDALNAEFNFQLDVCALDTSAKCDNYFTPEDDGLAQEWTGACWMNPPYGDEIGKWIAKAHLSADAGATVVCLVPARVDTGWWWDHCRHAEIRFLRGRLKFGGSPNSAPFPSAVVVFGAPARVVWWQPDMEALRDAA
jgi:phage N-6-adenine-methyltransferase